MTLKQIFLHNVSVDSDAKVKQLETDILDIMQTQLSRGQMDGTRAREIAKMVLEKLQPHMSLEQIYAIAPTLDDHFTELSAAIFPIMNEQDDKVREIVSKHAEELIRSGKLEEATALIKSNT